jgi:capsular exopolysaccharide synthesis family protein
MQTPLYTSTVRLQIDRTVAKIIEGGNVAPAEGSDSEFMRTQLELLMGRAMAERVASTLKLGEDTDFLGPGSGQSHEQQSGGKIGRERVAAGVMMAHRTVQPVIGSRLVDVSYSDPIPSRAQAVAAAYADTFIAANLDKRFQASAYAKVFLDDHIKQLKLRLEESEKTLLDFAQKQQIVATSDKTSIAESNLAAANAAIGNLISERVKNETLWRQVDSSKAINLPQLLSNSAIDGLRGQRNTLVTAYQEKLETFKPSYPEMIQLRNKIAEVDRQLAAEVKTIKSALKASYESSRTQEDDMRQRIEALSADVVDLQRRSIEYNILKREVDTNRSLYDGLLQRYKEVDIAGGVEANNVFVVDKAMLPGSPSSPRMSRALVVAFTIGLGLGLAVAYVLERFDDRIRSAEDIERVSGLATLGIVPRVIDGQTLEAELTDVCSGLCEAYRSLCTALQFSTEDGLPKSLVVTSSGPGEGKSTTAWAIARHFAGLGLRVLLVDGDMRNPSLHVKLGLPNSKGLSNYLTGACAPPELLLKTELPNLAFMASGPLPPNAADLLGSSRLYSFLSVGLEVFDLIVVDSPPVLGLADTPLLASAVAATVFVAGAGEARVQPVFGALKRLQFARSSIIGTVVTKFEAKGAGYGYDYGYGYGRVGGKAAEQAPKLARVKVGS